MENNYCKLPKIIHDWMWLNKAWLVGSSIDWYLGKDGEYAQPKDLDILIPHNQWNNACKLIDKSFIIKVNSLGGFKTILDGFSVDFWPDSLDNFLETAIITYPYQIRALRLKPYTLVEVINE